MRYAQCFPFLKKCLKAIILPVSRLLYQIYLQMGQQSYIAIESRRALSILPLSSSDDFIR